jgi:hypothetical protein
VALTTINGAGASYRATGWTGCARVLNLDNISDLPAQSTRRRCALVHALDGHPIEPRALGPGVLVGPGYAHDLPCQRRVLNYRCAMGLLRLATLQSGQC